MKPAPFAYRAAATLDEALVLLAEHGDEAKLLSGGQSLVPLLNMRLAQPAVIVDISRVPELAEVTEHGGGVRYGATTVHARFEDRAVSDPTGGLLHTVAAGIGYRAIRTRGTLGGSLAHADGSAEWPLVMAALGAELRVRSAGGERTLAAAGFVEGYFTSALTEDEALVAVDVPRPPSGTRWGFAKAARKPGEFAESLAVALLARPEGGADAAGRPGGPVGPVEVWLGAAAPAPLRVDAAAAAIPGERWNPATRRELMAVVAASLLGAGPGLGNDGVGRYHRHLHGVTVALALDRALAATTVGPAADREGSQ